MESLGPLVYEGEVPYNFKLAAKFISKAHSWQHATKRKLPTFQECCYVCNQTSFKWTKSTLRKFNAVMLFWSIEKEMHVQGINIERPLLPPLPVEEDFALLAEQKKRPKLLPAPSLQQGLILLYHACNHGSCT